MKLNPSMRENFRYMLIRILPVKNGYDPKQVYLAVSDAMYHLFGDAIAAKAWISVMSIEGIYTLIRCRRGTESLVEAAIASVTHIGGEEVAMHPIKTSGTIKTLRETIANRFVNLEEVERTVLGRTNQGILYAQHRIDLKEKGFNQEIPHYIIEEDIEDLNHDE